eukprot:gnl/MRDRNA2_/MRDRNA2_73964_c0_seq1.p1 gnl/MRDRNA2_/MRDRNA2_73964_c0~~gnl/MRDRNA2_/MRDRNA2_73964_c0_seq1.p1  ORF type:complete len:541 (-),score=83.19 gnl/MRDRNA2_/MRDRNA2_73964_c0_seq1:170-1792(-)
MDQVFPETHAHIPRRTSREDEPVNGGVAGVQWPGLSVKLPTDLDQEIETAIKSHKDVESNWLQGVVETARTKTKLMLLSEHKEERMLVKIVNSQRFNILTTAMICINGIIIGVETDHGDGSLAWEVLEFVFLVFYTIELLMRFGAGGVKILKEDGWIRFDTFVMLTAFLDILIISPMQEKQGESSGQAKQIAMVLRITRLMKLTRIVRLLRFFKELWLLVRSFVSAFQTLAWTFVLLMLVLYLFGILFVRVLREGDDNDLIAEWFGTLPGAMFTLFQIVTLENWAEIAREVWKCEQSYMVFVILLFIMITNLAIMNTVTAVIVEHTLTEAMDQQDDMIRRARQELHNHASDLVHIFCIADENHNGMLSKNEFVEAIQTPETRRRLQEMGLGEDFSCLEPDEIALMFETIDIDNSGELTPQEFVKGLMQMRGNARARNLFEMDCRMQKMHHMNRQYYDKVINDFKDQVSEFMNQAGQESTRTRDALRNLETRQTRIESHLEAISAHLGIAPILHRKTFQQEPEVAHTRGMPSGGHSTMEIC